MTRREFLLLVGSAVTASRALRAQQKAMPVIGFLSSTSAGLGLALFHQGLSETGYVEGQNVAIEYRSAEGRYDRLPALAADLVDRKVDVIATVGTPSALAAKRATSTIPIVFNAGDPVESGLVASLARPGANLTGISILTVELMPKRLELLSELVPQAGAIALLVNPNNAISERITRDVQKCPSCCHRLARSTPIGGTTRTDKGIAIAQSRYTQNEAMSIIRRIIGTSKRCRS
jgi:putative ABC transport system substrate-binding protein